MSLDLCDDLRVAVDPGRSFRGSLKEGSCLEEAVVNGVLFPFVVFLVYFANWGRSAQQVKLAVMALCITALGPVLYFVGALYSKLPGGQIDMEIVAGAIVMTLLWGSVALSVVLRWQHVRLRLRGDYPQCAGCGYNLTGNVSRVCPECGCATKLGKGGLHDGTVT
jgi:hypothetical protein